MAKRLVPLVAMLCLSGCAVLNGVVELDPKFTCWNSAGYDYKEYRAWSTAGFCACKSCRAATDEIARTIACSGPCASEWKAGGFEPSEAVEWKSAGLDGYSASACKKDNVSVKECVQRRGQENARYAHELGEMRKQHEEEARKQQEAMEADAKAKAAEAKAKADEADRVAEQERLKELKEEAARTARLSKEVLRDPQAAGWGGFESLLKIKGALPELDASAIAATHDKEHSKAFQKGKYFLSTMPATIYGRTPEQMGHVIASKIESNGETSFRLLFPRLDSWPSGFAVCLSRVTVPKRRYQDFILKYEGLQTFVNAYEEKQLHPVFRVVAVCGWNSYGEKRNDPVYTYDQVEVKEFLK